MLIAAERTPTEVELQAIARAAYETLLSEICQDQRATPHHAELHSATNLAFADYYQRLSNNGGHASLLPAEERRLSEEEGWDSQRIEDPKVLDQWFDRLPISCGKAPWHREPETTLDEICRDAEEKIEAGEYEADMVGLLSATTNKHFRKLAQIHEFMRGHVPVDALKFSQFMVPDGKDERNARAAYTLEQGRELFSLPPWTGCQSVEERLEPGNQVYHDSLFFVPLLVWYTGMRREEVCKLLVTDVSCLDDIWYLNIGFTSAGRVKNHSAVRLMAISDELIRLGFAQYFKAIHAAGHGALFPELVSEREGAKKGDTFYKLWWIYIAPQMKTLQRGQALHAARHTVSTELNELEVFEEHRNDALGHKGKGKGEGSTRYAKATRVAKIKALVDQIPIVTDHLPDFQEIRLLPPSHRRPRPRRG